MQLDPLLTANPALHFTSFESNSISASVSFDTPEANPDTFYAGDGRYNEGGIRVSTPSKGKFIYFALDSPSLGFDSSDIHFYELGYEGYFSPNTIYDESRLIELQSPYKIFDWDLRTGRVYVPDTAMYQGWDYNVGFFIKSNEPFEAEEEFTLSVFSDPSLERQISSKRFFIAEGNDDDVIFEEASPNIVNNTINNISNTTVVNIDNTGSGDVSIGEIGVVD